MNEYVHEEMIEFESECKRVQVESKARECANKCTRSRERVNE